MKQTNFTKILKDLRTNSNLTYRDLANKMGISASYLYDLENGNREPNEKIINDIIRVFKLGEEKKRELYDRVAESTNNLPFDVIRFLKENEDELAKIIETMEKSKLDEKKDSITFQDKDTCISKTLVP